MEFTKIKHTKTGGIELKYKVAREVANDATSITELVLRCKDEPHPDFKLRMNKIKSFVVYDEGLKSDEGVNVTGVSLFGNGETAIITHTREIKTGTTARNSGRISQDEEDKWTTALFEMIQELIKEAVEYVKGKRAQLDIFSEEAQEGGSTDEAVKKTRKRKPELVA